MIQKYFKEGQTVLPAKSSVCCQKKNGIELESFQNKAYLILTLILATKIQFGQHVWRVDLTLFLEQNAVV